ncbi:hypothetical protein N7510_000628 [Penicillium lagena]|uniref:uncharacterized protein n=1 Tax=Penicillium lagena TaxID=94218 RepID=UPI00254252F3|nr:uncharacterized protein N7510_000628 [Penicillium lagena]KAJ5624319.1 hypothetical protein N7510_000628 [Penicillium lagena]
MSRTMKNEKRGATGDQVESSGEGADETLTNPNADTLPTRRAVGQMYVTVIRHLQVDYGDYAGTSCPSSLSAETPTDKIRRTELLHDPAWIGASRFAVVVTSYESDKGVTRSRGSPARR